MGTPALYLPSLSRQKQDKAVPSFLSEHLKQLDPEDAEGREMFKRVAGTLYGGGTDTVVSANSSFFLLMSLHPDVQRKAQEEIDRVVGHDRLPNAQDRKDLPYVDAVMREVARLNTVVPLGESQCDVLLGLLTCALGLPHRLREDDIYEGMLLSAVVTKNPSALNGNVNSRRLPLHERHDLPPQHLAYPPR